jgi:hypothetical protein
MEQTSADPVSTRRLVSILETFKSQLLIDFPRDFELRNALLLPSKSTWTVLLVAVTDLVLRGTAMADQVWGVTEQLVTMLSLEMICTDKLTN